MSKEEIPDTPESQQEGPEENQMQETPSIETLQAELEEADRERGQFKALAQRAQADLVNFRKRVDEEREEVYHSIAVRFITKLLPVLDDLQRALHQAPASTEEVKWQEGVRLIERSLQALLESEGVTLIEADGKTFDPWEHEALFALETTEQGAGTVVSVIRPGYRLHGRILRAAQVAVAQGPEEEKEEPPDNGEAQSPQEREE